MKKQVYEIDDNGYLKEIHVIEEGDKTNHITVHPPQGLYRAKWTGTEWVEDMSQAEIDELNNQPRIPTKEEILEQELANTNAMILELTELILGGM
jgi:hypothetical protein